MHLSLGSIFFSILRESTGIKDEPDVEGRAGKGLKHTRWGMLVPFSKSKPRRPEEEQGLGEDGNFPLGYITLEMPLKHSSGPVQ